MEMRRRFGSRLEATVVYYRQEQHMSYARTQKALLDLHQVEISQGGIDEIMKRAGKWATGKTAQNRVDSISFILLFGAFVFVLTLEVSMIIFLPCMP
jgi:type IV secretory pathway component VirB8